MFGFQIFGDCLDTIPVVHAVELLGINHHTVFDVSCSQFFAFPLWAGNDNFNRDIIFPGESEVALIMCRHGHDGAGAVTG